MENKDYTVEILEIIRSNSEERQPFVACDQSDLGLPEGGRQARETSGTGNRFGPFRWRDQILF